MAAKTAAVVVEPVEEPQAPGSPLQVALDAKGAADGRVRHLERSLALVGAEQREIVVRSHRMQPLADDFDRRRELVAQNNRLVDELRDARVDAARAAAVVYEARFLPDPSASAVPLEAAEAREAILAAEPVRLAEVLEAAVLAGDEKAALAAERAMGELPTRRRVAKVTVLRARIAQARAELAALEAGEHAELSSAAETARRTWEDVIDRHGTHEPDGASRADVAHAQVGMEEAAERLRRAAGTLANLRNEIRTLERDLRATVRPMSASVKAPVVRSLPHAEAVG